MYIDRLIKLLENLKNPSGANIHERANILSSLYYISNHQVDKNKKSKIIDRAEKFLKIHLSKN